MACVTFSLTLALRYLKVGILSLFSLYLNISFLKLCFCSPQRFSKIVVSRCNNHPKWFISEISHHLKCL